jgi:hypothetical protein
MSNSIIRCFHRALGADTSANDLSGSDLQDKKDSIISAFPAINPALFTASYWEAQRWHYTSLQTLLGDSTNEWIKNKFSYLPSYDPSPQIVPYLAFSDKSSISNRGSAIHLEGDLTIQVTAESDEDNSLAENISNRIIQVLGSQSGFAPEITVPNNIEYLRYVLQNSTSETESFDTVKIEYHYAASFLTVGV